MNLFPTERVSLSKSLIDKLPLSLNGKQITVYDKNLQGFALRIGATSKTFIVYKRLNNGSPKRVTLGKYGHLTIDQARQMAQQELAKLTQGIDPNAVKKQVREELQKTEVSTTETLGWLLDKYEHDQIKGQKGGRPTTLKNIELVRSYFSERTLALLKMETTKNILKKTGAAKEIWIEDKLIVLADWLQRPVRSITKKEVLERFDFFATAKPTRNLKGPLQPIQRTHQIAFKFLSSAFNFYLLGIDADDSMVNPCDILKAHKRWKKTQARTRRVIFEKKEGANWFTELGNYAKHNEVASDYILFSLLQAGRSNEIADLSWDKVDFELKQINFSKTKNGKAYQFPVTKLGMKILKRRHENKINEFVFGYAESEKYGYITQSAKGHFENIAEKSGVLVSHHDLRRTWGTTAEKLLVPIRTIDHCLKHTINDVNSHYLGREIDTMLEAMQKVEDYFLSQTKKLTEDSLESNS